ncbi:DMT family transporter [Reichenbachiella sp. MALMAid0571]
MNKNIHHLTQLGLAILIMSSSGTLGSYISLPPPLTIWIRCFLGVMALWLFLKWTKQSTFIGWGKDFQLLAVSSIFLGLHWVSYFYALSASGVAVGMLSLFTYPVITSLLEPFMLKTKFKIWDMALAFVAFSGIFFLIPEYSLDNSTTVGAVVGMFSAFFYSIRNILLKKNISEHSGSTLMYYQLLIISILLCPVVFLTDFNLTASILSKQWHALLILGLFTTTIGHTLFVMSFKHFTITAVSIISNLTPLFGIILGYLFLNEVPNERVLIGGGIIMFSVMAESIRAIMSGNKKGAAN